MFAQLPRNTQAILLGILSFAAFAVSDATGKLLTDHYDVWQIIAWNALFTAGLILVASFFMQGPKVIAQTKCLKVHLLRGFCNLGVSILIVLAFMQLQLAVIYTLLFVAPFISSLLAVVFFREKLSIHGVLAICGGFTGVLVVMRPGVEALNLWLFIPLATTLFVSGLWLLSRLVPEDEPMLNLAFYPSTFNLVITLPISLYTAGLPGVYDLPYFFLCGIMLVTGLISGTYAFRMGKTSVISPLHYTQMLWGIVFGYLIFADVPDFWTLIGAVIIIGSGLYLIFKETRMTKFEADHV